MVPGVASALQAGGAMSASDMVAEMVLSDWESMREERVQKWKLDRKRMIQEYGEVRDKWMSQDMESWLRLNQPYEGVPDCLDGMLQGGAEVFIITTKQRRFCQALLEDFGLELPQERIFGLEDGPKTDVLASLLERADLAGKQFHFIEDKLGTLEKVAADSRLSSLLLYLVDWGYNTEKDRKRVQRGLAGPISMLSLEGFPSFAAPEGGKWI